MVLLINQETFNDVVEENIKEFGMSQDEAIADAIKQFEVQGVDLSNIQKKAMSLTPDDTKVLMTAILEFDKLVKSKDKLPSADYVYQLSIIKAECDKGIEYRVLAGQEKTYNIILDLLLKNFDDVEINKKALNCMISLMTKQPDLLDDNGVQTIIQYLDETKDPEIHRLILKWVKECCVMHEENRQKIFDAAILDRLKVLLEKADPVVIREVLAVLRALVLDDDVRVEFGKSHEHARIIAKDTLKCITAMLSKFKHDESIMTDGLLTLSSLIVRAEFCTTVDDAGGLDAIKDIMITFHEKEKLIKQCFMLLKKLSGNDEVKSRIIQMQLAPIITASLDMHKTSVQTSAVGLSCLAALTLRSTENSKAFYDAGMLEVIVNTMKQHLDDISVQRNGSWAIRNMVSRSQYQTKAFLDLGVEDILFQDLKKFPDCEYDIKSALRDLGCSVQLKEEWTGKGGRLNTQSK